MSSEKERKTLGQNDNPFSGGNGDKSLAPELSLLLLSCTHWLQKTGHAQ